MSITLSHPFAVPDHVSGSGIEIDEITVVILNRDMVSQETLGPVTGLAGAPAASFPAWLTHSETAGSHAYQITATLDDDANEYPPDFVVLEFATILVAGSGASDFQDTVAIGSVATPTAPEGRSPYADVSFADSYFESTLEGEAWFRFDERKKFQALVTGSDDIDRLPFDGYKTSDEVATDPDELPPYFHREFPRVRPQDTYPGVRARGFDPFRDVPEEIKRADCEQALFRLLIHEQGGQVDARRRQQMSGVTGMTSGRASESYSHQHAQNHDLGPKAWDLVHPWVAYSAQMGYFN